MKPPVAPPYEVQCRGWEAAYVLFEEFRRELPVEQRIAVQVVMRIHPDRLGWSEVRQMLELYRAIAGIRV
jgi:hypothetical protein